MNHEVKIKAKGDLTDSYEAKILEKTKGISDPRERMKLNRRFSVEAVVEIQNKILDTIFISELDFPLYILAMECLTEALKGCMENMGILREPLENKLDVLRKITNLSVIGNL